MKRDYLSYSALKAFAKSPNHYLQYVQREFQETNAMKQGSALHCLLLEPEDFADRYIVAPEIDRRTKAGKAEYAAFLEAAGDKTVLTADQAETVYKMADSVTSHRKATYLLKGKFMESPVAGNICGIDFRGIVDAWDENDVIDLKTTADASPAGFRRAASNFDYHLQAAIYMRITRRKNYYWIAVESTAPYNVAIYEPTPESLEAADAYLQQLVASFMAWDGKPVGYGENIYELDLPPWHPAMKAWNQTAKYELDNEDTNFNSFIESL